MPNPRCRRCQGLVVPAQLRGGRVIVRAQRCVNCGDVFDRAIELNRWVTRQLYACAISSRSWPRLGGFAVARDEADAAASGRIGRA